jgi:hypothetical protein
MADLGIVRIIWTWAYSAPDGSRMVETLSKSFHGGRWLHAARLINEIQRCDNTSLISVGSTKIEAFQEYAAKLKPAGVHW